MRSPPRARSRDRHRGRGVDDAGKQPRRPHRAGRDPWGALGNIVDRARFGYVLDFADLHFGEWRPFLVFNVADAAISIGVVILILRALLVKDSRPEEKVTNA